MVIILIFYRAYYISSYTDTIIIYKYISVLVINIYQMEGGMLIGIFDNKQKKKKVNKKENVHEEKRKLSFYYNTIYIKDNSLNEELIEDFKECGYKNKSDYLNLLIKKGLESKRKEKDILDNEGVTSAVKELITKVESLEKVVLSEQETFIKLINEVFKNEWI